MLVFLSSFLRRWTTSLAAQLPWGMWRNSGSAVQLKVGQHLLAILLQQALATARLEKLVCAVFYHFFIRQRSKHQTSFEMSKSHIVWSEHNSLLANLILQKAGGFSSIDRKQIGANDKNEGAEPAWRPCSHTFGKGRGLVLSTMTTTPQW